MLNSTLGSIKTSKQNSGFFAPDKQLQLPSINKRITRGKLRSSSSNSHWQSMSEKVQWITQNMPYQSMTEHDINQEYKRLRETLKELNCQIARVLERSQFQTIKSPAKTAEPEHIAEIHNKQMENNKKMIGFYRLEYAKLQKRKSEIGEDSKEIIQKEILHTKEAIHNIRITIKQLRKKNNTLSNSIIGGDNLIRQMRSLEEQKTLAEGKRVKMTHDLQKVMGDLKDYKNKSSEVNQQFQKADQVLKQMDLRAQGERQLKRSQLMIMHKRMQLQSSRKKLDTTKSQGEQRYLAKLKQLQNNVANVTRVSNKINQTNKDILESRNLIKDLQNKIKAAKQAAANANETETLFLTKPLDFSNYHSPSPITGDTNGHDPDKISDYSPPFEELPINTNRQSPADRMRSETVPVRLAVIDRHADVLQQNLIKLRQNRQSHQVQIGTEEEIIPDYVQPLKEEQDYLQQKFLSNPMEQPKDDGDLIKQKKRLLLQKLENFHVDQSTD